MRCKNFRDQSTEGKDIDFFEVGPKSDLCLHKRHGTALTANYYSLYLSSDFADLFYFSLILILLMCVLRQCKAC